MELGYEVQLEQRQQLSQNQIQSLEILAMDGVELNRFLQNEYLENPLLDYSGTHGMGSGQEEINKSYEQTLTYGRNYEDMISCTSYPSSIATPLFRIQPAACRRNLP